MSRFFKKFLRIGKDNPQHGSESTGDRSKFTVDINVGDGPEFEYEWSTDERGQRISSLWQDFVATYEQPSVEEKFRAFVNFSQEFVAAYSDTVENSNGKIVATSKKNPACIEETQGHPSEVVVQVACLLTEILEKDDDDLAESLERDASACKRSTNVIQSDTLNVTGIKFAFPQHEGSRDKVQEDSDYDVDVSYGRRGLLLLIQTFSYLVHWEHNKNIFESRLGSTFATNFIGVIRFLIDRLDDFISSWISVKDNAIDIDHPALSDLREDTSFVFSVLILICQFIAKSCPSMIDISHKTSCGFLPPQPWKKKDLQAFGYKSLVFFESELEEQEVLRRSRFDSSDEQILDIPSVHDAFSNTFPLESSYKQDAWCAMLISAGADNVIIDIVRKVSDLGKVLAMPPGQSKQNLPHELQSSQDSKTTKGSWTETAYEIWKKCVVLQDEVLLALLGLVATHPVATSNRFLLCQGAQALNAMMLDSSTFSNRKNPITNNLVFRRGILCLRLNELLIQHCSTDNGIIIYPEALGWFFSWMRKIYSFDGESVALNQDGVMENIIGCTETSTDIGVEFKSDLWPWKGEVGWDSSLFDPVQRTPLSYRLCHKVEILGSKLPTYDDKLDLDEWAAFSDGALKDVSEVSQYELPWFLQGRSSRAWYVVFTILMYTTFPSQDSSPSNDNDSQLRNMDSFELVILSAYSTLEEGVKKQKDSAAEDCVPLFHMHFLLFVARCVRRRPVNVIEYLCDCEEIWKCLFGQYMFLGGRSGITALCKSSCSERMSELLTSEGNNMTVDPLFRLESPTDGHSTVTEKVYSSGVFFKGYMWFYLHDSVLDLTTMLIRTANTPPTNRIISTKKGFEIKPIIQALQMSSEQGYDDVTFQLLRWMCWYLHLFSTKSASTRNFLSSHFFRAALAVCGYQLSDIGAYSIIQKEHDENPLFAKQRERLFMWASRKSAITLVDYILDLSGCEKWISLFLSKEQKAESSNTAPGSKSDSKNSQPSKTPAHQTLIVLFMDTHLRQMLVKVMLKILGRLIGQVSSIDNVNTRDSSQGEDDSSKWRSLQFKASQLLHHDNEKAQVSPKRSAESRHSRQCAQAVKSIYSDLFKHVKYASRQPKWFEGWDAAAAVLGGITSWLRYLRHEPKDMKWHQSFFRYGSLISELVCNSIICINSARDSAFWTSSDKANTILHALVCLTAIMVQNNKNKAEFKSIMMTQLSRRNSGGKTVENRQLLHSSGDNIAMGASSIFIRYDEFAATILQAQGDPQFDTVLVLFEMILDSHIYNNVKLSEAYVVDPSSVSGGLFTDEYDRPQIANLTAIPLLYGILPRCGSSIQLCVLNSFHSLIVGRNSLINVSTCTTQMQPSLLDHVLDLFPLVDEHVQDCAVKLLQSLGRHSISVAQLKRLFQMMQSKGEYRPVYTSLLVRSLQGMIDDEGAPRHSFVFSGLNSGLQMPSIPRWPAANSFTFSLWLRVESPLYNSFIGMDENKSSQLSGTLTKEYRPYILCLRAANGSGLEISLKKHSSNLTHKFRICIRCFDGKGSEPDTLMLPGKYIIEGKWHYLAVSHQSSSGFGKRNEVEIMLDDKFVRQKFSFPNFGDSIENPLIGDCDHKFKIKDGDYNTTMRGQMSAIYLFAEALTEGQLRGIYALGPSYFYSFEPYDTVRRDIPQKSDKRVTVDPVLSVLDSSITSLIALAYNPAVWKNDLYLDNTPDKNTVKWKTGNFLGSNDLTAHYGGFNGVGGLSKLDSPYYMSGRMHARGLPGTYRNTTNDVRIALNSLGGVKALLPLFAQFDQPRFKPPQSRRERLLSSSVDSEDDSNSDEVDRTVDAQICVVVLELLKTLLVESAENEVLLRDIQATALISYFLEKMSPQHMNLDSLNLFVQIYDRIGWNSSFPPKMVEHILLNFKLWVFTPFEVQNKLFDTLESILTSMDKKILHKMNVVQSLLSALHLLYGYSKPNFQDINVQPSSGDFKQRRSSVATSTLSSKNHLEAIYSAEKWVNSGTHEVMGEKLTGNELKMVREKIVHLTEIVIRRGDERGLISPRDVSDVIVYIAAIDCPYSRVEVASILFSLLTKPQPKNADSNFCRVLAGCALDRGLLALIPLFLDKSIRVRLHMLLILCTTLSLAAVYDNINEMLADDSFVVLDEVDDRDEEEFFATGDISVAACPRCDESFDVKSHEVADYILDFPDADTLNSLGFPVPSIVGMMLLVLENLLSFIHESGTEDLDNIYVTIQAKIITQAMLCTLIGEPCAYLMKEVETLPIAPIDSEDGFPEQHCEMGRDNGYKLDLTDLRASVSSRAAFFETVELNNIGGKHMSDHLICFPMVFPALLCIVKSFRISLSLRLSAMVSLRTILLRCDDNSDHILRISAWQNYFLQLILELQRQKAQECGKCEDSDVSEKVLTKYDALIDTALTTLCDIQVTAIRIGRCLGQSFVMSPSKGDDRMKLSSDRIIRETKSGERQLGMCVLRESLVLLKNHHSDDSNLNEIAKNVGYSLIEKIITTLHQEYELVYPSYVEFFRDNTISKERDEVKIYSYYFLNMNQWLLGVTVKEFLCFFENALSFSSLAIINEANLNHSRINAKEPWQLVCGMCDLLEFHAKPVIRAESEEKFQKLTKQFLQTQVSWVFNDTVNERSLYGTVSVLLSLLCKFAHLGNRSYSSPETSQEVTEISLEALNRIDNLMKVLRRRRFSSLQCESLSVVASLVGSLHTSSRGVDDDWTKKTLQLLVQLVGDDYQAWTKLFSNPSDTLNAKKVLLESLAEQLRPPSMSSLLSKASRKHSIDESLSPPSFFDVDQCLASFGENVSLSSVVIIMLGKCVNVEVKSIDDVLGTAKIILENAVTISDEVRSDQFTDIGLHKSSSDVKLQIENQHVVETNVFEEVSRNFEKTFTSFGTKHKNAIERHFRNVHNSDRRVLAKWNVVVSSLANERGPWGYGTNPDVYWTMDSTETDCRMHPIMRQNEDGTKHQMATFLANAKGKKVSASEDSNQDDSSTDQEAPGDRADLVLSSQNLWKDITKYQKSVSGAADDSNQQDMEDDAPDINSPEESADSTALPINTVDTGKVLFKSAVDVITVATNSSGGLTKGTLEATKSKITFTRFNENDNFDFVNRTKNTEFLWACQCFPSTSWPTVDIHNLYHRHYQQRNCALELFFTNRQTVFLVFENKATARQLYNVVRKQIRPPYIVPHYGHKPISIMTRAMHVDSFRTVTQAWVYREISNFDYLMFCNTVAGRSYNDLSQYPIFPWVIANYTSNKLNLNDPNTFRDLRWPMGAQNESQREIFQKRYNDLAASYYADLEVAKKSGSMSSDSLPPFHYGSHYSTMGFVLWYLVRYEPFTSLNIWMQDGRFDKTDRIFDTMEQCYRGVTTNQSDVKELIPEFFYCPEFLQNPNGIDLGETQGDNPKALGDVGLPPWAKSAKEFVRLNRMALESEYVSANLHHWIDLIFGYKQRPRHLGGSDESVDACNVYFHLTYNGAVDLENLKENDEMLYDQTIRQISNFGQTPALLFRKPHPQRLPISEVDMFWPLASVVLGADTIPKGAPLPERPRRVVCFKEHQISDYPIVLICELTALDKLITIDSSRIVGSHMWQVRPPDVVPPFQIKTDQVALKSSQGIAGHSALNRLTASPSASKDRRIGAPFAPHQLLRSDFVYDVLTRETKLQGNNKALFEKEESARSNWRIRSSTKQATSPSLLKAPSQSSIHADKSPSSSPSSERPRSLSVSSPNKTRHDVVKIQRVDEHISSHIFALLPEHRIIFSCGHWDYSIKASSVDSCRLMQSVSYHKDVVTCMALASDFGSTWLVTGSRDCTVIVWDINPTADRPIIPKPAHLLYGHDDAINCVAVNPELDIVVSGSDDGTIIVHKLREGIYVRSISLDSVPPSLSKSSSEGSDITPNNASNRSSLSSVNRSSLLVNKCRIHFVGISMEGYLLAYSNDDTALYSFTLNGDFAARKVAGERLNVFKFSEDHKVLITGGERALLVFRWVHSLELSNVGSKWEFDAVLDGSNAEEELPPFNSPIRSIYLTKNERHLIVGLESGELRIMAQDSDYLRKRLHSKLMEIGILEKIDINKFV